VARKNRAAHQLTPEVLAAIERLTYDPMVGSDSEYGGWCGEACEIVSEYLASKGIGHFVDWTGTSFDDSHTFIRLGSRRDPRFVLDPSIRMFKDVRPGKTDVVAGFPHHPAAPTIAVIPDTHPLYKHYGGHTVLLADQLEALGLAPYREEDWLPKSARITPEQPHAMYREAFERAGVSTSKGRYKT